MWEHYPPAPPISKCGYRIGVVTQNVPPIQCNTPADVKTDEAGDAGASPVSGTNFERRMKD